MSLLPQWLGVGWAVVFLAIAASHVAQLRRTVGQQRPWHACHVLIAVGMAAMYLPAAVDPVHQPAGLWQALFAVAGLIGAAWALLGTGRVSTLVWLLTAGDLAAMLYMWSPHPAGSAADWLICAYLVGEAALWVFDLYRRFDGGPPLVSWRLLALESGVTPAAVAPRRLLSERDISASMIVMTLGMAYMLVAM